MKNLNMVMMVLGLILTGCNSTTSTPEAAPVTSTQTNYGSHLLFVAENGSVASYTIDSSTGFPAQNSVSGIFQPNWSAPMDGTSSDCSIKLSPLGTYLFAVCSSRGFIEEYSIGDTGLLTSLGQFNLGVISTNYNADALAFDSNGTLYVHVTENISPNTEKVYSVPFNESTNTLGSGTLVTSGYPSFEFTTTAQLDDVTYEINASTLAIDLDRDGAFADSMSFGNNTPTSIAIK